MKNAGTLLVLGVLGFVGAGALLMGCKSAPELTQAQAQALIQAKFDQTPAVGANVVVDQTGLGQGVVAKYWERTKLYPNRFWADFTLSAEGKKALQLPKGGDVIQWRPESPDDKSYSVIVVTLAANHLKALDLKDAQDETLPGVATAKGVDFKEGVNLDGVPGPLADIAHNPGNQLSTKRHADFSYENGAWVLRSIE
ncbi:MAG: hypothetical protein ABR991_08525 [Terracidiphilus sp.]